MRKIIMLLLAVSILTACNKNEKKPVNYVVFSGDITNSGGGNLTITKKNKAVKAIKVDENGKFLDTIKDISEGFYDFRYGNETSKIYLKPGFNIKLHLDPKEFDESISYTGTGSDENNYLAEKFLRNETFDNQYGYMKLGNMNEEEFLKKMDSIKQMNLKALNETKDLNQDFKKLEEKILNFDWAGKLMMFEGLKRYITKNPDYKVSDNFPDVSKGLDLEDESLLGTDEFDMFLPSYYMKKAASDPASKDKDPNILYMDVISKSVKSQKIKNELLFDYANQAISYANDIEAFYKIYMKNETNEEYKEIVTKKYNKLKSLVKGSISPKFNNYENYKGGITSLDDFKGKYVYIDVWATWCGPCKAEIPFLKKITDKFKGKNIVFISMSIDKASDHDKWKAMVKDKELHGVQLFAPNNWNSDFVTAFGIRGIPRFILIDPEGKIVSSNAPRPSNPKLKELFKELGI